MFVKNIFSLIYETNFLNDHFMLTYEFHNKSYLKECSKISSFILRFTIET